MSAPLSPVGSLNLAVVAGVVSRSPRWRTLPSGDVLLHMEVRTQRAGERADTVPVAVFGPSRALERLREGSEVVVLGRVQRRFFTAGGQTRSRTQITADRVVPAGHGRRAASLLERARASLAEAMATQPDRA
ncbi:MAG: single-stranded DNA-binding protein [Acidimicrobiia bacterium]|nr:single-stranded DNA-binding protein [Acidimicrobiia bacterium]MDH5236802.1 single-stranded DNA-binding protein [Acidimicrobiia bacterium]